MKKKISYTILFTLMIFFTLSCTSTLNLTVVGKPGTKLYNNHLTYIGSIGNDGKVSVSVPSDKQQFLMFSQAVDSDQVIPFALDYNEKSYTVFWVGHIALMIVPLVNFYAVCRLVTDGERDDFNHNYSYERVQYTNEDLRPATGK